MQLPLRESRYLYLALALAGLACGSDRQCRQPEGRLGSCCNSDADCDATLSCIQQVPGGICSVACAGAGSCPGQALCIKLVMEGQDLGRLCLPACQQQADCPEGLDCTETTEPGVSACFPDL